MEQFLHKILKMLDKMGFFALTLSVCTVRTDSDRKAFEQIWYPIWLEQHYAEHESIKQHYAEYDFCSQDVLVKFLWFPVGTIRLIQNRERRLPTLNDLEIQDPWESEEKIFECTLLTVRKTYRGISHRVLLLLVREAYRYSVQNEMEGVIVAADRRVWYFLRRYIHLPFHKIGPEQFYEGSLTIPGYLDFREYEKQVLARSQPRNLLEQEIMSRFET